MADPKQTAHTPHLAEQFDLPHSEAGHNPYWCGGDNHMRGDQGPCWGCINFFLAAHDKLVEALEAIRNMDECDCDCSDDNCCAKVGVFCAHCYAEAALRAAKGESHD